MAADYVCPYCGAGNEAVDYWEKKPEEPYEVECGECGRTFEVGYCLVPGFTVELPSELRTCIGENPTGNPCDYWDHIEDCCSFGRIEGASPSVPTNEPCPLGHRFDGAEPGASDPAGR